MIRGVEPSLLRLLALVSPALPVGAYAYSDGLETAIARGWIRDERETLAWIGGRLEHQIARVDLPILARLRRAGDEGAFDAWAELLRASRDSAEARAADRHLGQALARLLVELGVPEAARLRRAEWASLAAGFAVAGRTWDIEPAVLLAGYAWSIGEGQVSAAIKLVPLGQTAGQRILAALGAAIPALVETALTLADDDIGASAPAAALAGAWHERQPVRLFRS